LSVDDLDEARLRAGAAFFVLAVPVFFFLAMVVDGGRLKVVRSVTRASPAVGAYRSKLLAGCLYLRPLTEQVRDMAR
jgi:hypothetical protein